MSVATSRSLSANARRSSSHRSSPARPAKTRLRVLPTNYRSRAARHRRARRILIATSVTVCALLFGLVAFHVVLMQEQFRLEKMKREISQQEKQYSELRAQVAGLESPDRIINEAKLRLGMQEPSVVHYVAPSGVLSRESTSGMRTDGSDESWARVKHLRAEMP